MTKVLLHFEYEIALKKCLLKASADTQKTGWSKGSILSFFFKQTVQFFFNTQSGAVQVQLVKLSPI